MSISMTQVTVTHRDGRVTQLDQVSLLDSVAIESSVFVLISFVSPLFQVYIRGSSIRFYVVPDMLQQAPMCVQSSR